MKIKTLLTLVIFSINFAAFGMGSSDLEAYRVILNRLGTQAVRDAIRFGSDVNFVSVVGDTPLKAAIRNNKDAVGIVTLLLENGAIVTDEVIAMAKDKGDILKLLLDKKAEQDLAELNIL